MSLISINRYLSMNMPNLQSFGKELPKMYASEQFLCRLKEVWHAEMQSKSHQLLSDTDFFSHHVFLIYLNS